MNLYEDIDDELLLLPASAMQPPIDNIREDDGNMLTAAVVVKSSTLSLPLRESGGGAGTKGVFR